MRTRAFCEEQVTVGLPGDSARDLLATERQAPTDEGTCHHKQTLEPCPPWIRSSFVTEGEGMLSRSHLTSPLSKHAKFCKTRRAGVLAASMNPTEPNRLQHGVLWRGEQRLRTLSPAEDQGTLAD